MRGVDQNELAAGIDEPDVERRWDTDCRQVSVFEEFFGAGLVASKQLGFETEAAVTENRHLIIADLMPKETGSVRKVAAGA